MAVLETQSGAPAPRDLPQLLRHLGVAGQRGLNWHEHRRARSRF